MLPTAFAYLGERCASNGPEPSDLTVVTLATMRTRSWNIPKQADVSSLSLSADGGALAFNVDATKLFRSFAYVLPTGAPAGAALQRARVVARAGEINSDMITPDGTRVYFTTVAAGSRWQLRVADLRTGRTHVIGRYLGLPVALSADPAVDRALVTIQLNALPGPSPSPSPVPSTFGTPSASPVPTPVLSPSAVATPVPSPSAPAPSPSAHAVPVRMEFVLIELRTGLSRSLRAGVWRPATSTYAW